MASSQKFAAVVAAVVGGGSCSLPSLPQPQTVPSLSASSDVIVSSPSVAAFSVIPAAASAAGLLGTAQWTTVAVTAGSSSGSRYTSFPASGRNGSGTGSPTVAMYVAEQLRLTDDRRSPQLRDRSRSPLNLTVSPSSRRSTADSTPTAPSPAISEPSALPPVKLKLQEFFNVGETSVGILEEKTRGLCHYYMGLTSSDRLSFLRVLAVDYGVDRRVVQQLLAQVTNTLALRRGPNSGEVVTVRLMERLRLALIPRYQSLFMQISRLDNGVRFLANMRADVISALKNPNIDLDCPQLMTINSTLHQLLSVWLSLGSIQLERITWQTPCDLLQKISAYEAVQPIRNLVELRRRVGPYKRCFCFTHSAMPREPLIVVHTALTQSISHSIQSIVGVRNANNEMDCNTSAEDSHNLVEDVKTINAAVFYSITSTQRGLQGVELGGQVIKSVMLDLVNEFPRLHQFASLSPIPGYREWLIEEINSYIRLRDLGEEPTQALLTSYELAEMSALFNVSESVVFTVLRDIISGDEWIEQPNIVSVLQTPLMRLCARYLYVEKKRGYAINPVANFHLHNGAVLWRLNWLADTSPRGVAVSCTIMANYRYYLEETDANRRKYVENQILTASDQVLDLLRQPTPSTVPQINCRIQRDPIALPTVR